MDRSLGECGLKGFANGPPPNGFARYYVLWGKLHYLRLQRTFGAPRYALAADIGVMFLALGVPDTISINSAAQASNARLFSDRYSCLS